MTSYINKILAKVGGILDTIPGKERFGSYRLLPLFFCLGAGLEFAMIKWKPGGVNFYQVYIRKQKARANQEFEESIQQWKDKLGIVNINNINNNPKS